MEGRALSGASSLLCNACLNIKDIAVAQDEVLRLATSLSGDITASLMMKKLASYPKQNGLAKALRGLAASNGHYLCWTGSVIRSAPTRQAGLNKGEARNALARAVFLPVWVK
jgi:TnpA family transposase